MLLKGYFAEGWGIDRTKLFVEELMIADDAYHGRIVRRIRELGYIDLPTITAGVVVEGIAQAIVG